MTTWRMLVACWITKVTIMRSESVRLFFFYGKDCYAKAPQCTFPVLFNESNEKKACVFYVFLTGITKNSSLTGCDAASLDEWLPKFRRDVYT